VTRLLELASGDDPAAWARLGFAVGEDGRLVVGGVGIRCDGCGGGLRGWTLAREGAPGPPDVEGIPTAWGDGGGNGAGGPHPNGATAVDHVVVLTGDVGRTTDALVAAGGDERRRAGPPAVPRPMAFVRLGPAIIEVAPGEDPPRLWGLVPVVPDLDGLAAELGPDVLGAPRPADQPGRSIATVRRLPGLGTAVAFMSPRAPG